MKTTKKFKVYPDTTSNIEAQAMFENGEYKGTKLVTKLPRGQYYSVLNDALCEAERLYL